MAALKSSILTILLLICTTLVLKAQAGIENSFNIKIKENHFNAKVKVEIKDGYKLLVTESTNDSGITERRDAFLHSSGNSGTLEIEGLPTSTTSHTITPFRVLTHRLLSEFSNRFSSTRHDLKSHYIMLPTGYIYTGTYDIRGPIQYLNVTRSDENPNLFDISGLLMLDDHGNTNNSPIFGIDVSVRGHIEITPDGNLEQFVLNSSDSSSLLGLNITLDNITGQNQGDEQYVPDGLSGSSVTRCGCINSSRAQAQ
ncbi:hypothetical protein [Endozoicomonas euniceicola]|uniref:Uncharacterized protein n=1 Tax=Endozoicomonas euniceicola TaxID=1234143 RepID=A0ABY6GP15_9GAMM|nr:hypothetical protein [Endozoicomonas euniceicola]UYM14500.1 hypothetical protein NX720_16575 [Endozoicomonas euniceicola]